MNSLNIEIGDFHEEFLNKPAERKKLIEDMVVNSNRLLLNIPKYGPARGISKKLKEESFSIFYEFEKNLAKKLHPVFSRLNLNLISDLIINDQFNKKYGLYYGAVAKIADKNKHKLNMDLFKDVIQKMVINDGHYMAVKFYDLILRNHDEDLAKELKPVEVNIINLKKRLGDDEAENIKIIKSMFLDFKEKYGDEAGRLFVKRMEWDDALLKYVNELQDSQDETDTSTGSQEDERPGGELLFNNSDETSDGITDKEENTDEYINSEEDFADQRILRYAGIIKKGYLDKVSDDNEKLITDIVDGLNKKNIMKYGESQAGGIVPGVINFWLKDESIGEKKKDILKNIFQERFEDYNSGTDIIESSSDEEIVYLTEDDLTEIVNDDSTEIEEKLSDDDIGGEFDVMPESVEDESVLDRMAVESEELDTGSFAISPESVEDESVPDRSSPESEELDTGSFAISPESVEDESVPDRSSPDLEELDTGSFAISPESVEDESVPDRSASDLEELDTGSFAISPESAEDESVLDGSASGSEEMDTGSIPIESKAAEVNEELKQSLENKWDELDKAKEVEGKEIEKNITKIKSIQDKEEKIKAIFDCLDGTAYEENRILILNELPGEDNFFAELMHHLIDLSGKLSIPEMKAYINSLIEKFTKDEELMKKYPNLIERLGNYRDSLKEDPPELLKEINLELSKIEKKYSDDKNSCIEKQYEYLNKCLEMEKYNPIKRTIAIIIENLLSQNESNDYKRYLRNEEPDIGNVLSRIRDEIGNDPVEIANKIVRGTYGDDSDSSISDIFGPEQDNDTIDLEKVILNPKTSPELRSAFKVILNSDKFLIAFNAITRSIKFSPRIKVVLLDKWLRNDGEKKGWFETDREKKIAKIDRMVEYYSNLSTGNKNKKKTLQTPVQEEIKERPKKIKSETTTEEKKDEEKKDKKSQKKEAITQDNEVSKDEKISQQILTIIKHFDINVESIEPLIARISRGLPENHRVQINKQIEILKNNKKSLINETINMVKQKKPDEELVDRIHKSSSYLQYLWSNELINEFEDAKKLEDIFNVFENNKKFYAELNKIIKIIKINNKNNLLKNTIDSGNRLIKEISQNFSGDELKKMWKKTASRKNKDNIKLFRELISLIGESEIVAAGGEQDSKGKISAKEALDSEKAEFDRKEAGEIKPPAELKTREGETNEGENSEIKKILEELENFLKLYKIPKFRKLSESRIPLINQLLSDLANGEDNAVSLVKNHKSVFVGFMKAIIHDHPELKDIFNTSSALQYCKEHKLL